MDDLAILKDPHQWTWMVCPVRSRTRTGGKRNWPLTGFVRPGKPTVYVKNMFELRTGKLEPQLEGVETFEYKFFEELVADGWVVD